MTAYRLQKLLTGISIGFQCPWSSTDLSPHAPIISTSLNGKESWLARGSAENGDSDLHFSLIEWYSLLICRSIPKEILQELEV